MTVSPTSVMPALAFCGQAFPVIGPRFLSMLPGVCHDVSHDSYPIIHVIHAFHRAWGSWDSQRDRSPFINFVSISLRVRLKRSILPLLSEWTRIVSLCLTPWVVRYSFQSLWQNYPLLSVKRISGQPAWGK